MTSSALRRQLLPCHHQLFTGEQKARHGHHSPLGGTLQGWRITVAVLKLGPTIFRSLPALREVLNSLGKPGGKVLLGTGADTR